MAVTIKDIAKKVGVSPSTVSRVINGNAVISEETTQKIMAVMEELNYHPNSLARNFANRSTNTIGLVIDAQDDATFSNAFFNRSVYAIERVAQENGYNLLITNDRDCGNETAAEKLIFEKKVDGIMIPSSVITSKLIDTLIRSEFPFIVLGEPETEKAKVSWVDINNTEGGESAVEHLVLMGYRKIAFLLETGKTVFAKNRIQGYQNAIIKEALPIRENFIRECGPDAAQSCEIALQMLAQEERPDAFLCSNNLIAFYVLKALKEKKIKVPEEVGVVTFDNYPFAEYMEPPLTVVDVDTFLLGEQAAMNLIQKIKRTGGGSQQTTISTNLIIRESSVRDKHKRLHAHSADFLLP